ALDCYTCSYIDGDRDASCVNNASAMQVLNCTKKYCVTVRIEQKRNASKVLSFLRDCLDEPLYNHGNNADEPTRTYYTSCKQNLCNGHNGRMDNSTGGSAIHNAIVPGKSSGQKISVCPWFLGCFALKLSFVFK
ncbi:hypothetical protein KR018_003869, partial [Drosophila ironensis]